MKYKKNHDKDLSQKSGLFFVLGLILILAITYLVLEWKTLEDNSGYQIDSNLNEESQQKDSSEILETKATKKPSTEG